ncbi:MAG: UDP-N-acetylglucosamine 1-carboxyvinyltransferase [candidate division Zixibacteria bacterium]|nr:UDP-N-acetylglucosamine 1-carboxyvinyltransferase [candidate division Zixibacteria bacterium]
MDKFVIHGGKRLSGTVEISGSKNAALPILIAGLLVEKGKTTIKNVPNLADIETILNVLNHLGVKSEWDKKEHIVIMDASNLSGYEAPYELVRKMRASFMVMGPLLARLKKAKVSLPGGCVLGPRPIDYHLTAFAALGAKITEGKGYVTVSIKKLKGAAIHFDKPSHTGTENVIMAACLADGKTTIVNAACDPEVIDLADFLNKAGAKIKGAGNNTIEIEGVRRLKPVEYSVMPDRLEAGTMIAAAGITGGEIVIKPRCDDYLSVVIAKLEKAGMKFKPQKNGLKVSSGGRLESIDLTTFPYPGFPTDLQASMMSLCCISKGISHIIETVFTDRFTHVMELIRLGADIKIAGQEAVITGVNRLNGASVMASDIRAGAGLVVAALAASGKSEILRVYHIDRGYEHIEAKLQKLGADIQRLKA